ncbi:lipase family protein [Modestobacter lapidis]|nr:lipase family protein [Modestobacter lapidis]
MSAKLVFLHGVGDGDPRGQWLTGVNRGLEAAGYQGLAKADVIAPRYSDILCTDGVSASVPPRTYVTADEEARRRDYERRQARVSRLIGHDPDAGPLGYDALPPALVNPLQDLAVGWPVGQLDQVNRYMSSDGLRGAVLRRVLEHLPSEGEIVLVGHSLGSVVAIDLLDHLSVDLKVKRFITIGSPAGSLFIHEKTERLLKRFPYGTVEDWSNLLGRADPVTAGRGLGGTFPAAQDFFVGIGHQHAACAYFEHASVATLLGEALQGSLGQELAPIERSIEHVGSVPEQLAIFALAFAHHVRRLIDDKNIGERYAAALEQVQEEMGNRLRVMLASEGRTLSPSVRNLADGKPPRVHRSWDIDEAIEPLVLCALSNLVQPYDIDAGKAPVAALRDMAIEIGIGPESGVAIGKAIAEVRDVLVASSGIPWTRILVGAAGVALIATGPLGIAFAAPVGAYGGAAIVGALAAFGPGGMIGGMALLGGLASTGAAVATGAATVSAAEAPIDQIVTDLLVRVSSARARQMLDVAPDEVVWFHVVAIEAEVAAELNRLSPLSDPKSPRIADLRRKLTVVRKLLTYMGQAGMQPRQLQAGSDEKPAA